MANPEHVEIVRKGAGWVSKWRQENPHVPLDLSHADLSELNLSECDLRGACLVGAKFDRSNLERADLSGCDLTGLHCKGTKLENCKLVEAILVGAVFEHASLANADLHKCQAARASFSSTALVKVNLQSADLRSSFFVAHSNLAGTNLGNANLSDAKFDSASLENSNLSGANADCASFREARLNNSAILGARLIGASFEGAMLNASNLTGTSLVGANLRSATFDDAILTNADLKDVEVDTRTSFHRLRSATGCRIDRYTLTCLGDNCGLSTGNQARMIIVDDLAFLRSQFGGIWTLVHVFSIGTFVFPYGWFLVRQYARARFFVEPESEPTVMLWVALARFIWSGGRTWKTWSLNFLPFATFLLYLFYNVVRGLLLYKTKRLETEEQVRRLPVIFSLAEPVPLFGRKQWHIPLWLWLYRTIRWGFWISIALLAIHTIHFLSMRLPVDS